jgi:hypothetical protein
MMQGMGISTRARIAFVTVVIAGMAALVSSGAALAHTGHAHEESGGGMGGILQIAATVAALVVLHVLATWYFRYRDRESVHDTGNRETGSAPE